MKIRWKTQGVALALTAGILLAMPLSSVFAADEELLDFTLEQVVVTATKTAKTVREVPAAVTVVTKKDLEKKNIRRIEDALKEIPGVRVRQKKGLAGVDSVDNVTMRGFTKQGQILVLVDGVPINDSNNQNIAWGNIPIDNVERIEVIRGAGSAIYGSQAMGGVINIITQDKAEQKTTARLVIGENNMKEGSLYSSGTAGKLDYFVNVLKTESDGYVADDGDMMKTTGYANKGENGMEREQYGLKLSYHFNDKSKVSLSVDRNDFEYFYEHYDSPGKTKQKSILLSYENRFDDKSFLKVDYSEKDYDKYGKNASYTKKTVSSYELSNNESKSKYGEIQYNYQLGERDLLTVGYVYQNSRSDSQKINYSMDGKWLSNKMTQNTGGKTESNAIYIQNEHNFNDKMTMYLGARYDQWHFKHGYTETYNNKTGNFEGLPGTDLDETSINPKIGLVYKANKKLTLRTSYGTSFRTPTIYDLACIYEDANKLTLGNPNLKPEKSKNFELGADYNFGSNLIGRFTFFDSNVSDLITTDTTGKTTTGKKIDQKVNVGKSSIRGIELELDKKWTENFATFVNFTYTQAKIKEDQNEKKIGTQINDVPRRMINLGINYNDGPWNANVTGRYASDPRESEEQTYAFKSYDPYFVVDFKVAYQFNQNNSISLSIDNIFDRVYYDYYRCEPRTTFLEFSTKF